ncbi:MAG: molybdopterin-dependent oxidoreductase, partial [Gammaproteobacteria bacterium]|nr:molybdopterin-dependent oxidoreductase [Gammaproteobacteria bacterium]
IGSPRASIEANYALMKRVGKENFYAGFSDDQFALVQKSLELAGDPQLHTPSIREIEQADAVLVVGEDVTNIAPRIALALRQSVRNRAAEMAAESGVPEWQDSAVRELAQHELSPLYQLSGYATRLDDIASETIIDDAAELAHLGFNIARAIDSVAPVSEQESHGEKRQVINAIAADLKEARRPLIICGTTSGSEELLSAAANIARALISARGASQPLDFCCLLPEVNTAGHGLMVDGQHSLGAAFGKMRSGDAKVAIVIENDLYTRAPAKEVDAAIAGVDTLVSIDQLPTRTTDKADVVLASTTFAEQKGTYVNYEGRAQLSMQVFNSRYSNRPCWRWLAESHEASFNELLRECNSTVPGLSGVSAVLPDLAGTPEGMKIPRQPHRYSGRTAMKANENVHEAKQQQDEDSVMAFTMEGMSSQKNATLMSNSWAPQWNSNQSISKFQDEVAGELRQAAPGKLLYSKRTEPGRYQRYQAPSSRPSVKHGGYSVIPAFQLYGSDELSSQSAAISERLIGSYAAVSPADAKQLGVTGSDTIQLQAERGTAVYPVCVRSKVKPGTVVVFDGANNFPLAKAGEAVRLARLEGGGNAQFGNLIVSDLHQEGD